jgi:phospholipid/cholesterol/gamma-HCH transport system permease protein
MTLPIGQKPGTLQITRTPGEPVAIAFCGELNAASLHDLWPQVIATVREGAAKQISIDTAAVSYCDGAGLGLLAELRREAKAHGTELHFVGGASDLLSLIEMSALPDPSAPQLGPPPHVGLIEQIGRATFDIFVELRALIGFFGAVTASLVWAILHPRKIRWAEVRLVSEKVGANAMGVVCLLGFLIGVILAFQSAVPMQRFGAIQVIPAVVSVSVVRELGPLITAILLAGRSGSAFAAEIGTMKITEELSALECMGLDPLHFLVLPRVIAAILMTPLLTVCCVVMGVLGGYTIMTNYDYSFASYINAVKDAVSTTDFLGGVAKTIAFAFIVAGVGCLRGTRTQSGPGAVGDSTTKAVVASIVLVIVADGFFGVLFFYLRI